MATNRLLILFLPLALWVGCKTSLPVEATSPAPQTSSAPVEVETHTEEQTESAPNQRCQAWIPTDETSTPPEDLVTCEQDADCSYGLTRACCGQWVVALQDSRQSCLAEETLDANCRANCVLQPAGYTPIVERPDFTTRCVDGACRLSWEDQVQVIHFEGLQ